MIRLSRALAATAVWALLALCMRADGAPSGRATRFDFTVQRAERCADGWEVVTPGARFVVGGREIRAAQRVGARRWVVRVRIPGLSRARWRVDRPGSYEVRLADAAGPLRLTITGDSVLRVAGAQTLTARGERGFQPEYRYQQASSVLLADPNGGTMLHAPTGTLADVDGLEGGPWRVRYPDLEGVDVLVSVFPPRPFDWELAREEVIVHHFPHLVRPGLSDQPLPTDGELAEWRRVGNVLVLHLEFWNGFGVKGIRPLDPERFAAVMQRAHALGWKVLLYTSPFYYGASPEVDDYEAEMRHLLRYGPDGLYWDGTYLGVEKAWEVARRARRLLGQRRLYVHCTATPFSNPRMICPFVDTYADYLLRGEAIERQAMDPLYIRYVVSGYNLSNAVGTLCYETCRLDREMMQAVLGANARIPFWPGGQVAYSPDGRPIEGRDYFLHADERRLYLDEYLTAAARLTDERRYEAMARGWLERLHEYARAAAKEQRERLSALRTYLRERKHIAAEHPENLAALRPVRCSEVSHTSPGPHGLGFRAEYANDLNDDTFWAADFAPQWVQVDLERVVDVGRVVVRAYSADRRFYHYDVLVSRDGRRWETVARKESAALATAAGDVHTFDPRPSRFVRVLMRHNSANVGLHVVELEVYRE